MRIVSFNDAIHIVTRTPCLCTDCECQDECNGFLYRERLEEPIVDYYPDHIDYCSLEVVILED